MFTIRAEQLEALAKDSVLRFENELAGQLAKFAPKLFELRGEQTFHLFVQSGMAKAETYGFTKKGPVRFFLETMVALGSEFDTDPQIPGLIAQLRNPHLLGQMDLAERIYDLISDFLAQTKGSENQFAVNALRRLSQSSLFASDLFGDQSLLFKEIERCYPEKYQLTGTDWLAEVYQLSEAEALELSVPRAEGAAVITTLKFALGHGVLKDPMYPWVINTLGNEKYGLPHERLERLKNKARIYLDKTLSYLPSDQ